MSGLMSTKMLSSRLSSTPCRLFSSHVNRSLKRVSANRPNATPSSILTPSSAPQTVSAASTILKLSRKERDLHAIQETTGLLSEREKRIMATKEAKRAKFAERMHNEHGDNWEAIVADLDRVKAHKGIADGVVKKKKVRWTQQQKDENAARKAEKRAMKDAKQRGPPRRSNYL